METTGTYRSYDAVQGILSFEVGKLSSEQIQTILGTNTCDTTALPLLDIKAVVHRKKRSLDANAYSWVLISKIAEAVKSSKEEIYEEMLRKYGVMEPDAPTISLLSRIPIENVPGHWFFIKSNGEFSAYKQIKGSSEYNTKEMAHFIDMIVGEAKELGIETIPPDELQRMKERWGV